MLSSPEICYSPALRLKKGELNGIAQLAPDVADSILPRMIVLPKNERDIDQPWLLELKKVPDFSVALSSSWRKRRLLLDLTHVLDEFGCQEAEAWLPQMFERARNRDVCAIPTLLLKDFCRVSSQVLRSTLNSESGIKLGIGVPFDAVEEADFQSLISNIPRDLGLQPSDCVVFADFTGTDFEFPSFVSPIIADVFEQIRDCGDWAKIIFQGTHFPELNPTKEAGQLVVWPRNEWAAWREALDTNKAELSTAVFGDYAADSAKINFDGGGRPIEHLRYATSKSWLIKRGIEGRTRSFRMHSVHSFIAACAEFSGREFSEADVFIGNAALSSNEPQGDPTTWRQLNTTHHVTQAVADLTRILGGSISRIRVPKAEHQFSLFK